MNIITRGIRRRVIEALIDRVEVSFPNDWSEEFTVKDVVRFWLRSEEDRPDAYAPDRSEAAGVE